MWGKSIDSRAPGIFISALKQLAERADFNALMSFPPRTLIYHNAANGGAKPGSHYPREPISVVLVGG
jgi:hypothetical protein